MSRAKEKAPAGTGAGGVAAEAASLDRPEDTTKSAETQDISSNGREDQEFELPLPKVGDAKRQAKRYYTLLKMDAEDDLLDLAAEKFREMLTFGLTQREVTEARKYVKILIKHLPEDKQDRAEFDLLGFDKSQEETGAPKVRSEDYVNALAGLGYTFRLNQCDDSVEVNGQRLSDPQRAKIRSQIRDLGFKGIEALEDAYTAHAYDNGYHPIRDYLDGLEWDGQPHIATLASYVTEKPIKKDEDKDEEYTGIFYTWLRRWLIGAVAKVYRGSQNPMLVLDGPQDLGKSHFAAWLASPMADYFYEGPINTDDKDCRIRLMNKWLWEVAELGSTTRRTDREALKYFLSMETVTVRKPYGRLDTIKPAMASFVGTVNNEAGFLSDPTGSRRFLVCSLTEIDWSYAKDLDPGQVWAEAHAAYLDGETWRPTADEREMARAINKEYELDDPIEGMLYKYFKIEPQNTDLWLPSADILDVLETNGLRGNRRGNSMALGSTMGRLGCERKRKTVDNGSRPNGYYGIALPASMV